MIVSKIDLKYKLSTVNLRRTNILLANVSTSQGRVDVYKEMSLTVKLMCVNLILFIIVWLLLLLLFYLNQRGHHRTAVSNNERDTGEQELTLQNRPIRV